MERKISKPLSVRGCAHCAQSFVRLTDGRGKYCSDRCKAEVERNRTRARPRRIEHGRHQAHRRRATQRVTDLRAADLKRLLAARTYCPLCRKRMSEDHRHPHAKHVDHIIPIAAGGTHTHGNVRVICRTCNLKRPKDGSDVVVPVTLWAQDLASVPTIDEAAIRLRARQEREVARAQRRDQAARRRHDLSAGRAAIALALRLQGHAWSDVAIRAGYIHGVSARTSVLHHWPEAESDILKVTREAVGQRYWDIKERRDQGQPWKQIASELGYANDRSARRCYRTARARVAGGKNG